MNEFVAAVHELETQERSGYPCRECGETFSTHPSRVEYAKTEKYVLFSKVIVEQHFLIWQFSLDLVIEY